MTSAPAPTPRTRAAAAVLVGLGLAAVPAAASAHVRVNADSTASGSYSALTFRVPNESDDASTVRVSVQLPQDTPFASVSTKPLPGWTVTTTRARLPQPVDVEGTTLTEAVRAVTWTADRAGRIGPGQYQEFSVAVGPLPAPGTVLLPATQTYSDGEVVAWNEPTPASGAEPDHPAPELEVTAASDAGSQDETAAAPAARSDTAARVLAGAGLAAGLAALVLALLAWQRART